MPTMECITVPALIQMNCIPATMTADAGAIMRKLSADAPLLERDDQQFPQRDVGLLGES